MCSEDIDVSEYYDHKLVDHDQLRSAHVGGYSRAGTHQKRRAVGRNIRVYHDPGSRIAAW